MNRYQGLITYLLIFLALSIILELFNLINFEGTELISYVFIFLGIGSVYLSFGRGKGIIIFFGSLIFLTGLILFLFNNFEFTDPYGIIFPAVFLVFGISALMVFFDNMENKVMLLTSLIFILTGFIFTMVIGSLSFTEFVNSIVNITLSYWPVILIVLGIILIITFEEKKK